MYTIKLDGQLLWDPRVKELEIDGTNVKLEVNKAGSLTFRIYSPHPLYNQIKKLKSVIEVYQDSVLIFRGRPLDDALDTWNVKEIICEGDLALFNDSIVRPYEFNGSIADYLSMLITNHNSQAGTEKHFALGNVTVTDPNNYIVRASSDYPNTWKELEDKLLSLLGGYLVIRRTGGINYLDYLEDSNYVSGQVIQLGENLLKVNQERRGEEIATAIIPIGAEIENEDGVKYRVDIKSVNNNVDYVYNQEAVDTYGWVFKKVEFRDVTEPSNLLTKANQALADAILLLNTIELTAVDLSMIDVNIDEFMIFEYVEVVSTPHQLDDMYLIRKMDIDLTNPENNTITVGAEYTSLTDKQFQTDKRIEIVTTEIIGQAQEYTNNLVNEISTDINSAIQQTAQNIKTEVGETYTSKSELETYKQEVSTDFEQTKNSYEFGFNDLTLTINNNQGATDAEFELIRKYIRFEDGNIILGESGNQVTLKLENDILGFYQSGSRVAYLSDNKLFVTDGEFINSLRLGNFAFEPRSNGNLSFRKVV